MIGSVSVPASFPSSTGGVAAKGGAVGEAFAALLGAVQLPAATEAPPVAVGEAATPGAEAPREQGNRAGTLDAGAVLVTPASQSPARPSAAPSIATPAVPPAAITAPPAPGRVRVASPAPTAVAKVDPSCGDVIAPGPQTEATATSTSGRPEDADPQTQSLHPKQPPEAAATPEASITPVSAVLVAVNVDVALPPVVIARMAQSVDPAVESPLVPRARRTVGVAGADAPVVEAPAATGGSRPAPFTPEPSAPGQPVIVASAAAPPTVAPLDVSLALAPQPVAPQPAAPPPTAAQVSLAAALGAHRFDGANEGPRDWAAAFDAGGPARVETRTQQLGAVAIEVARAVDGLAVTLRAASEDARAALADAQPRLAADARAAGVSLTQARVDDAPRNADTRQDPQQHAHQHSNSERRGGRRQRLTVDLSSGATAASADRFA